MWCPSVSLSVWSNAWLAGHAAPDDPIRIGLIGCGGRGTGAIADALGAATDVNYPSAGYHTENISAGGVLLVPFTAGTAETMAGRSMPGTMPSTNLAVASKAPVFPAETHAAASPLSTRLMPTRIEESFLRRSASCGRSSTRLARSRRE